MLTQTLKTSEGPPSSLTPKSSLDSAVPAQAYSAPAKKEKGLIVNPHTPLSFPWVGDQTQVWHMGANDTCSGLCLP